MSEYSIQLRALYPCRYVRASSANGSNAFKLIIATEGNEFCVIARTLSLLSISPASHGMTFLISS